MICCGEFFLGALYFFFSLAFFIFLWCVSRFVLVVFIIVVSEILIKHNVPSKSCGGAFDKTKASGYSCLDELFETSRIGFFSRVKFGCKTTRSVWRDFVRDVRETRSASEKKFECITNSRKIICKQYWFFFNIESNCYDKLADEC